MFKKTVDAAVAVAMKSAVEGLSKELATTTKRIIHDTLENDVEVRTLIRRAVKEHLEVMRDELVEIDKSNQELSERLVGFFSDFVELQKSVATLEKAVANLRPESESPRPPSGVSSAQLLDSKSTTSSDE